MRKIRFLLALILAPLAATSLALAAQSDDSLHDETPTPCLAEAASRFNDQFAIIKATFLKSLDSCEGPGPSGFADRCLLIATRRFELSTQKARDSYLAQKEACASVTP